MTWKPFYVKCGHVVFLIRIPTAYYFTYVWKRYDMEMLVILLTLFVGFLFFVGITYILARVLFPKVKDDEKGKMITSTKRNPYFFGKEAH